MKSGKMNLILNVSEDSMFEEKENPIYIVIFFFMVAVFSSFLFFYIGLF